MKIFTTLDILAGVLNCLEARFRPWFGQTSNPQDLAELLAERRHPEIQAKYFLARCRLEEPAMEDKTWEELYHSGGKEYAILSGPPPRPKLWRLISSDFSCNYRPSVKLDLLQKRSHTWKTWVRSLLAFFTEERITIRTSKNCVGAFCYCGAFKRDDFGELLERKEGFMSLAVQGI